MQSFSASTRSSLAIDVFFSGLIVVAMILILSIPGHAQNPISLWRLSSGDFGRTRDNGIKLDRTDLNNSLFIRLIYSSFGQDDAILVVNFRNQDGTFHQSYPVDIFSYKDKNKKVEIYGPQYYEGQDNLSVSFDLLLLKKDTMQRYKNKFDTFFKPASKFIPVFAQASSYIEQAWDAMKGVIPDTKTEKLGAIQLIRMTDLTLPSTENRWFLLGNPDALSSASSVMTFPSFSEDALLPSLPSTFTNGKNRLMLVAITKAGIPPSFSDLAKRQSDLLGDTERQRLGKLGIKIINPYDADQTKEQLAMNRIFGGFLALTELAGSRPGATSEFPVSWVVDEFQQGQQQGADSGSIIRLSTDNETRVSRAFSNFFEYDGVPSSKERGLVSIGLWKTWLDKRRAAKSVDWFPAQADATHLNIKIGVAPYGKATTKYVQSYLEQLKPSANPDAKADIKTRIQAMAKDIAKLKKILTIFRPTDDEPWLLYEQQYTAKWVREHLTGITDLPTKPILDSDQDVKLFADAVEKQLSNAKVLLKQGDSNDKWKFIPVSKYVSDVFTAALPAAASGDNSNKQEELRKVYFSLIDPIMADTEIPTAKDLADLNDFLNRSFPPDTLTKKNFTEVGFNDYFKNNIFTVEMQGIRALIKKPVRAEDALSKMKYAESLFSNGLSATATTLAAKNDLNSKRLDALRQLSVLLSNQILDISIRQKILEFLRGYAPSIIDSTSPAPVQNPAYVNTWAGKLSGLVNTSKLTWSDDLPGFVEIGSEDDLSEIAQVRALYDQIKNTPDLEPTGGRDATIERLIPIACGVGNSQNQRDGAFKLLQLMVELPTSTPVSDRSTCGPYQVFRSQGYSWVNGKYRLDRTASSATPSPTP